LKGITKRKLEIILSRIRLPKNLKKELEQYPISSPLAARILWIAHTTYDDISNKVVLDLGTGSGVLAIGAALLGAEYVIGVDMDFEILKYAKAYARTLELSNVDFLCINVERLNLRRKADTVVQNPPFGVYKPGSDMLFLRSAIRSASVVYSIHKLETMEYVVKRLRELEVDFKVLFYDVIPLPPLYPEHRERWHLVKVFVVRAQSTRSLAELGSLYQR